VFFLLFLQRESKRKNTQLLGVKMSRNFGWGSRNMSDAGRMAMQASGEQSFSSVATNEERFSQFADFAKSEGIGRMERITPELVVQYGQELAEKVAHGEMSASYAQNLVSSINTVMNAASRGEWKSVSPTKDCNIAERCNLRDTPTIERDKIERGIEQMTERGAAIASLASDLGLRSKEASLLDAKSALQEAQTKGTVSVTEGTKGGREREIPITSERQMQTLERAASVQGDARAVMPAEKNWKEFRSGELREIRESVQNAVGATGLHDLRASYAAERYETMTGHPAPCNGGKIEDRQLDHDARMQIASELGHGRIDVISAYIGGRS